AVAHQRWVVVGMRSGSGRQGRLLVLGRRHFGIEIGVRGKEAGPARGVLEGQPQRNADPSPEKGGSERHVEQQPVHFRSSVSVPERAAAGPPWHSCRPPGAGAPEQRLLISRRTGYSIACAAAAGSLPRPGPWDLTRLVCPGPAGSAGL